MRRLSTGVALLCLLVPALSACGSDGEESATSGSVEVAGGFGEAPEVSYDAPYTVDEITTEVLEEGDGEPVAEGDVTFLNIYVGNGHTGEEATSSWTSPEPQAEPGTEDDKAGKKGTPGKKGKQRESGDTEGSLPAEGEQTATPQMVTLSAEETLKPIHDGVVGKPVGSRILVSSPGEEAFGLGGAEYYIGNEDTTVFVIDIVSATPSYLDAADARQPKNAPAVVEEDGKVTGLDFSKAPKQAGDDLRVLTLVQGDGDKVQEGDQVALRYLGQVWGRKKPFDDNYGDTIPGVGGNPAVIASNAVIQGWVEGLTGVRAGSRVMLIVPSDLAYGKKGKDPIKPNEDLVFVVDVLAVP